MNILNIKSDIVKVLFYGNLIFLAIAIFYSSKAAFIITIIINIILNGTLIIINKYSGNFMDQFAKMWDK